jgi:hypothetical protein
MSGLAYFGRSLFASCFEEEADDVVVPALTRQEAKEQYLQGQMALLYHEAWKRRSGWETCSNEEHYEMVKLVAGARPTVRLYGDYKELDAQVEAKRTELKMEESSFNQATIPADHPYAVLSSPVKQTSQNWEKAFRIARQNSNNSSISRQNSVEVAAAAGGSSAAPAAAADGNDNDDDDDDDED